MMSVEVSTFGTILSTKTNVVVKILLELSNSYVKRCNKQEYNAQRLEIECVNSIDNDVRYK